MRKDERNDYCKNCPLFMDETNTKHFCETKKYKQRPMTYEATENVIVNAGLHSVCERNPWRSNIWHRLSAGDDWKTRLKQRRGQL